MPSRRHRARHSLVVALNFVEGDTEEEFFGKVFPVYLNGIQRRTYNLHGNVNIHNKIFDKTASFLSYHRSARARVYCWVDRESRYENPKLNIEFLKEKFNTHKEFRGKILCVEAIIATQMIESWFFYDIEGIYKFLRVPTSKRNPRKFRPPEKFTAYDLMKLFEHHGNIYIKGKRCRNFVNNLSIAKIFRECQEFKNGINSIRSHFGLTELP